MQFINNVNQKAVTAELKNERLSVEEAISHRHQCTARSIYANSHYPPQFDSSAKF